MKIAIRTSPIFDIPINVDTVALLLNMAANHYDGVCKQAGIVGGFLYGWNNSVTFVPELPVSATWREADTVLKICENLAVYPVGGPEREEIMDFTRTLRVAMRLWASVSDQWHTTTTPALLSEAERAGQ